MGLFDRFRRKSLDLSPSVLETINERGGQLGYTQLGWSATNQRVVNEQFLRFQAASYGWLYRNRPAVREVVDYIARNVAQLPLKCYERVSDTERLRDEKHPGAVVMQRPDAKTPRDAWIQRFVADFLVYDDALALKFRPPDMAGRLMMVRIPPEQFMVSGGQFTATFYRIWRRDGSYIDAPPEDVIHWHGYNPMDPLLGLSKLETLRASLTEDAVSQATSVELMKNGLKGGHIERPLDAPPWTQEAQKRFQEGWGNQEEASPRKTPVLEEGMKFIQDTIAPRDAEMLAGRQFTREEVCGVYGLPPGVLGLDPSTQLDEQRKQVYADVLPPITNSFACQFDVDLLEAEYSADDHYFEFDSNEKLRGDLESRFPMLTTAAGRPWLTVNEVRAVENKPPIDGGDELTMPLNVALAGDQGQTSAPQLPAPNVMPPQDPNAPPQDGSYRTQALERKQLEISTQPRIHGDMARQRRNVDQARGLLENYYNRQRETAKKAKSFDSERWNRELTADLQKFIHNVIAHEGSLYSGRLGGDEFDMGQVANYIAAMSRGTAEGLNRVTQQDVVETSLTEALDRASGQRAAVAGASIGTRATVFARQEAAKQAPGTAGRLQTWIADTDRHGDLDGVSVPIGSDWGGIEPGSEPNCACSVSIG